jgi:threonine aldolase
MRQAMADADVGDDVYGEDPTVRRLEERTAELLGLEAALFVPTGSMGNQIALRVQGSPGSEVLLDHRCHVFHFEMAGMATLSGLLPRPVASPKGLPTAEAFRPWIRPEEVYYLPRTSMISLENTHNLAGGTVARPADLEPVLALAASRSIPVHLDGARLWNAAAALGLPEPALTRGFSSVMVCFSKGLRAPVGSAVAGPKGFVSEARRVRKLFGGGMRQAGVLAAAALVALEQERGRLIEDHARARKLASELAGIAGFRTDPASTETNMVMVTVDDRLGDAGSVLAQLKVRGVLAGSMGPDLIRLVTHADVGDSDVTRCVEAFRAIAA